MVVQLSKSLVSNPKSTDNKQRNDEELKNLFLKMIEEKGGSTSGIEWNENGQLEMEGIPNLVLHSFLLQAEALGLSIKYTKKTVIEIL
jgi:hypothetical protein